MEKLESKIIVIGYGSTIREDDAIGTLLVEALKNCNIKKIITHELLPEHAFEISESGVVVFVDAEVGENVGEVKIKEIVSQKKDTIDSHQLDPQYLLYLSKELYSKAPKKAFLFTIKSDRFDINDKLSTKMSEQFEDILKNLEGFVETLAR